MRAVRSFALPARQHVVAGLGLITLFALAAILATGTSAARGSVRRGPDRGPLRQAVRSHPGSRRVGARAARLLVSHAAITAQSGQTVEVSGRLLTAPRGARVKLLAREGGAWRVVGRGRTRRGGRFHLRYTVQTVGATDLRVSVSARGMVRASAAAGQVLGLAPAVASWYYDAGNTACGFHATYGVANKTLPCGTQVTISYGGRSVVATVDDRGPYIYGRSYDLNQNTARALGMFGVAQVLTSV